MDSRRLLCALVALLLGGLAFSANWSWADEADEEQQDSASASAEADDDEGRDHQESEEPDPLSVPEGGPQDMLEFIAKLSRTQPEGDSNLEKVRWMSLASRAMADAADQGLGDDPTDKQAQQLMSYKLMALQRLKGLAESELELATVEARSDERAGVAAAGLQMFVRNVALEWDEKSDAEKADFRDALLDDFPSDAEQAAERASAIRMAAMYLERADAEAAKQLMKDAIAKLEASDNEKVTEVAEELAGMLRRMDLMGNAMELNGALLDGEELDWGSYRGKVVLVDFWATWCGPCVAEIPNVKEMYAAYHDKGFDVLGISLDTSKESVEKFLEEKEIPWKTMFGADKEDQGWDHPMARYYGISGIPTAILVDRDGRVVHLRARGEELGKKLKELLGDPAEPEDEAANESGDETESSEPAGDAAGQ